MSLKLNVVFLVRKPINKSSKIRLIDEMIIKRTTKDAYTTPKRRSTYCYHTYSDPIQRMVNCILKRSYFRPHKHTNKTEVFVAIKGKLLLMEFGDSGNILKYVIFGVNEPILGVEIPPNTWHSFLSLSKESAVYEIINGPYEESTHKIFPSWAPSEEKEGLQFLKHVLENAGFDISLL